MTPSPSAPGAAGTPDRPDGQPCVQVPGTEDGWPPGAASRRKVERIRSLTSPSWAFSGRYHKRVSATVGDGGSPTRWELLGCGGNPIEDQMAVVDVATLAGTPTISQVA